jgi:CrcB protein
MHWSELLVGSALVALGATVGTPARFYISSVVGRRFGETFPWGTFVVNVSGCLIMGVVAAIARVHGFSTHSAAWLLVAVGFLGSYTTVSSFALQALALARDGERRNAIAYVVLSVALCVLAVGVGFAAIVFALAGAGR